MLSFNLLQGGQVQGAGNVGHHRPLKLTLHLQHPARGQNGYNISLFINLVITIFLLGLRIFVIF